jgi:hypothetical protein
VERLRRFLLEHPLVKALLLGLFGLVGNVLAGAYVFDITKPGPTGGQYLDWADSPHSWSFWALVGVLVLTGLYGWGVTKNETRARKALRSDDEIRERAFEVLLDPMLERVKKELEEGKVRPMSEVFDLLGIKRGDRK